MNIKEDNMKILIRNIGCDDETLGLAYFEDADDLDFFIEIIESLNQNSEYPVCLLFNYILYKKKR